jgi:hypothetical protein
MAQIPQQIATRLKPKSAACVEITMTQNEARRKLHFLGRGIRIELMEY